jgi:biopolymer transport protein ExbD
MKLILVILLGLLIIFLIKYHKIQENLISFTAPELSSEKDKNSMAELMRLGSQGNANSQYDIIDTQLLEETNT